MDGDNFTLCPVSEAYKRITFPLAYGLVFVFGLTLNGTVLWFVCGRTKTWSCSVIFLANLSVADLLYVLPLPLLAASYAMGDTWPFGNAACKAVHFLFSLNLGGSVTFLACISMHRFLCARHPAAATRCRARRAATLTCAAVWLLVAVETAPTAIFAHSGFINNTTVCFDMTGPTGFSRYLPYGLFVTAVGFLLPLLVMVTCYCLTARTLCQAGGGVGGGAGRSAKAMRSILALCLLGTLCFLPYHAMRVAYLLVRVHQPANCRLLSLVMLCYKSWRPVVSLNCCVNPALYWSCSTRQRRSLLARLCSRRVRPAACAARRAPARHYGKGERPDGAAGTPPGCAFPECTRREA
ncbi:P2Y purinoceptor 6-like [Anguilla rostrata]|uniref:P2Y purinoceptor 6-like n=1 Tax=Anguilla rostrata TaxID=7938 RepID=UPI0030CC27ED